LCGRISEEFGALGALGKMRVVGVWSPNPIYYVGEDEGE